MSENTRFEEYEKKTRKLIILIGVIFGILFLIGLLIISSDEEDYNPEEAAPEYDEHESMAIDVEPEETFAIETEDVSGSEKKKPITIVPAQINMNEFVLGVDTQNQTVLTIGTDGTESIHTLCTQFSLLLTP